MKQYPSIPREYRNIPIYAFDKLDGSNIKVEWHPKKGLHKFGSRTQLIDETSSFGESITLIKEYENKIHKQLKDMRAESATLFFEFYGANSFAGYHIDEPHQVTLIDVSIHKKGFMNPNDFNNSFDIPKANLLYVGNCNSTFIESVKDGTLEGMSFEGVVCKGVRAKSSHPPIMFKVKNRAWIDKLKSTVSEELFNSLV